MKHFFFYPQWNYRRAETWLEQMEAQGYRLEKVNANWWFSFKASTPKKVRYIFTYNFLKEEYAMGECEHKLKSHFHGNQVLSCNMLASVYRISNCSADLSEVIVFRQYYLKHVFWQKIILGMLFFILPLFLLITEGRDFFCNPDFNKVILWISGALSLIAIIWYSVGLLSLQRNRKQTQEVNQNLSE